MSVNALRFLRQGGWEREDRGRFFRKASVREALMAWYYLFAFRCSRNHTSSFPRNVDFR